MQEQYIKLSDLRKVSGIGEKTIQRIKDTLLSRDEYISQYNPELHLDKNNIYRGDCLELMNGIPDKSVDLVVTDPPYLHNKGGNGGGHTKIATSNMYSKDSYMLSQMSEFTEQMCVTMLNQVNRVMAKMNAYFFCNDSLIPYYLNWALENGYKYTILTWNKPLSILNRERFSTNMEYIIRIYGNGTALNKLDIDNYPEKKDYYSKYRYFTQIKGKDKLHPTQKPLNYIEGIIELSSKEGQIVLDPFIGSGTTAIAAINTNRQYIGIELNDDYYELAKNRINQHIIDNNLQDIYPLIA